MWRTLKAFTNGHFGFSCSKYNVLTGNGSSASKGETTFDHQLLRTMFRITMSFLPLFFSVDPLSKMRILIPVLRTVVLFALTCSLSTSLSAQSGHGNPTWNTSTASSATYYNLAKPGEIAITVHVWGFVKNPGLYEVPSSANLLELISYAGGPLRYAKLDRIRIVRVVKGETGVTRKVELFVDLEHLEKVDDKDLLLYPGDTIVIDHSSWPTVRDALTVAGTAAAVAAYIAIILTR